MAEVFLRFGLLHAREGEGVVSTPARAIARAFGRSVPSPVEGWYPANMPAGCVCPSLGVGGVGNGFGAGDSGSGMMGL
jgi:hypothetical protein